MTLSYETSPRRVTEVRHLVPGERPGGRPQGQLRSLRCGNLGAAAIAEAVGIGRASGDRVLWTVGVAIMLGCGTTLLQQPITRRAEAWLVPPIIVMARSLSAFGKNRRWAVGIAHHRPQRR
jgi:hypothetical protein